jgi:hypothetical protein
LSFLVFGERKNGRKGQKREKGKRKKGLWDFFFFPLGG